MTTKQFLKYGEMICEKVELETDMFLDRVEALKSGNIEQVEYIEEMMIKPIQAQINYLVRKITYGYK